MHALRYAFDEATTSLWRGRRLGVFSTLTIAVAFGVLGALLLATSNITRIGGDLGRTSELSIYLADAVTEAEREEIERVLAESALVAGHEFVSKDSALARFRQTFADLTETLDGLDGNPLPASYDVRLEAGATDADVNGLVEELGDTPGVADVRYDRQWLTRLLSVVGVVRNAGLAVGALLALAAAMTVATVVRLALQARRDELDIMHLVGAPRAYVSGPFIVEGLLHGGLGAAVALTGLGVVYLSLRVAVVSALSGVVSATSVRFLSLGTVSGLLLGGMVVGAVGGMIAARRPAP